MSNRKNHNSIIVLATLGVYLGLVLVGATPQVLAQAAMTRQFNVKDEVEVKDDLDKKPKDDTADATAASELDQKITRSVEKLLSRLSTYASAGVLAPSFENWFRTQYFFKQIPADINTDRLTICVPIDQNITVTNLPRAGLDSLFAADAK